MDPSHLSIFLFGPFEVRVRGQSMPRLRSRSVEWLLAFLVLRNGRAVSRPALAGTLWPESSHERTLHNLRISVAELRRALGPEAERLRAPTRDSLLLELTGAAVDLLRFDAAVAAGAEGALQEAVALYRGELLEGCSQEWIVGEREARREACLQALERLADLALSRGEVNEALGPILRAEALDPLRDSLQRRRMRALAASGDRPAALLSYREYRLRLHREMNLEPDPETTRLFRELQSSRPAGGRGEGEAERRVEPHSSGPEPPPAVPPHPLTPSPPHSLTPPPRLPCPLTALLGREEDVNEVRGLFAASRLVTLVGGGGVGKTRLALEIAAGLEAQYPGRAAFLELAPLTAPRSSGSQALLSACAAALGLHEEAGPHAQSLLQTLIGWLSQKPTLLVLDNCEHLIEPAAELAQWLLHACPSLHILATSRRRLGLTGEVVWRVPSLSSPDPELLPGDARAAVEHVHPFPAVQLFLERAAAARPGFQLRDREEALAVARICRRLDGIPLALELAAARVTVLPITQIAARLDDRFRLLTVGSTGALPRHQTLEGLIDWSYDSLLAAEAALLRRLSVFAGGWTLEAAEAVCACGAGVGSWELGVGSDTAKDSPSLPAPTPNSQLPTPDAILDRLTSLIDRSLVLAEEAGEGLRYRMLETVREYAREKLRQRGEEEAARTGHLAHFLRLAEEAGPNLRGPNPEAALAQLDAEIDNFRAALAWCEKAVDSGWWLVDSTAESGAQPDPSLPAPTTSHQPLSTAAEAHLRLGAALWAFWETRGYLSEGRQHLRAALERLGVPDSPERAQALLGAARLANRLFDLEEAERFAQESLEWFRGRGDFRGMAAALLCLGETAFAGGQYVAAGSRFAEGLDASRQSGWLQGSAIALWGLGSVAMVQGECARARPLLEEGRALAEALGDALTLGLALFGLASLATWERDDARAGPLLEQSLEIWLRLGHQLFTAEALTALGVLARRQGDRTQATSFLEQAAAIHRAIGTRLLLAWTLLELGNVHYAAGLYEQARAVYEDNLRNFRELEFTLGIACASNNLGLACFHLGETALALALHREALAIYHRDQSAEGITWSLERLGVVEARQGDPERAARRMGAAAAAREGLGNPLPRGDQTDWDQAIAALRAALGPEAFAAAWAKGRAMSLDAAVRVALEECEIPTTGGKDS